MTVFVYVLRHRLYPRLRKQLPALVGPSNLSWKRPPRPRIRLAPRPWRSWFRRYRLRYQPLPPQPANFAWRPLLRPYVLRGKLRLNTRRGLRLLPFFVLPQLVWKRPLRPHLRQARPWRSWWGRYRLRYQPLPPAPVGFIWRKPLRPKVKRKLTLTTRRKLRLYPLYLLPPLFWKKPLRPKIKRAKPQTRTRRKYYSIAGPPASFVPKPARHLHIKRAKPTALKMILKRFLPVVPIIVKSTTDYILRARRRSRR